MLFGYYKKILSLIIVTTLSLPLSVFAIDVTISARVSGCGDGIIDPGIGEQCEMNNNNGESCQSLGYNSGTLSCTTACTFDVSQCSYSSGGGGGGSGGSVRSTPSETDVELSYTNVVFSGTTEPNSSVIILNNGEYFTTTYSNSQGIFITTVTNFATGDYTFTFYSLSPIKGLSDPLSYSISLQEGFTTKISNILITYPVIPPSEELFSETPLPLIPSTEIEPVIPDTLSPGLQDTFSDSSSHGNDSSSNTLTNEEIFDRLVETLSNTDTLSHDIIERINTFAEQYGYEKRIDQTTTRFLEDPLGFFVAELSQNFAPHEKVVRYYPNVYLSFMTPYWVIASKILHYI